MNKEIKTEVCVFEGRQISFEMDREHNLMINATEMAKIFDKKVEAFMRNENTQAFIQECLKSENSRFLENVRTGNHICQKPQNCGLLGIKSKDDLIVSKQKSGTWMHRVLALKFAAWLSPAFELWVYSTIEDILFGKLAKREKSFERTFAMQQEIEYLTNKIDKTGEDFSRYLELQRELKYETAYRRSLTVEDFSCMKMLF
jgi:hypothetical protein